MGRIAAALASFVLLTAFLPGQKGVTNGICSSVDPVMQIIKAAERDIAEANALVAKHFPSDECASVQVPVELIERLYSTKDVEGSRVEVWSMRPLGGTSDRVFYMYTFPMLDPSSDFNFGI